MIYCQECGSEIAEAEKFCPYCGISLQSFDSNKTTDADAESEHTVKHLNTPDISAEKKSEPENVTDESDNASPEDINMSATIAVNNPALTEMATATSDAEYVYISTLNTDSVDELPDNDDQISAEESESVFDVGERPKDFDESFTSEQQIEAENNLNEDNSKYTENESETDVADEIISTDNLEDDAEIEVTDNYAEEKINITDNHEDDNDSENVAADLPNEAENEPRQTENAPEESAQKEVSAEHIELETATDKPGNTDELASEPPSQTTPNIGVEDTDGSSKSKLKPLEEGTLLNGRYEITRKIGGGGMGAVYLANDKNLGDTLRAVKEMVQSYIEEKQQEKAVDDFKRESLLLSKLDHPAIPTIYDYFYDENEGRFYLVMKYISGGDLAARIRSAPGGKVDELSVTDWAWQIADVLEYLHTQEPVIVYRDLKPANIMIDGNTDRVMLIDFGIARSINKEQKGVTAVGTMGYAPPELFSGNVQPGSDIYSLGSTMFHLLTGADPQNNPLLIFDFQKHPRPRQINPQISDQMERILMRAVEYNAEKRFKSAAEMKNTLKDHLENLKAGKVSYGVRQTPQSVALSDESVFCGFCGQKIVATDMFCAFCGAKQPLAQAGVHSQDYHGSQATAKLVIEGTSDLEYPSFNLVKNENLVGRRDPMSNIFPEIDLSKFDPQTKISRTHARIRREGDKFMVEDLGSSNGTYLKSALHENRRLIPNQSQMLQNGDKIKLGDTTLQFIIG